MAPSTPSTKSNPPNQLRTPQSKHRLNFNHCKPSPNPNSMAAEHPVEVIGRIRDHPEEKKKAALAPSALLVNPEKKSLRVKTEMGYRDFSLDGVSMSEEEDLDTFYQKFVQSRINGVKLGAKCTVMMYGPTGAGKSHTMFGCVKQPGIVYKSLKDILGDGEGSIDENGESVGVGTFVHVTVLEIYNEEIYDLLPNNSGGGGFNLGWPKAGGSASKVRLEVMGKKAKNATFIAGYDASKISKEIQKVEKRRIVKSTLCNERSSRSHCMIILDVPTVGGRLMLVDMAGSENIEQAGQTGLEAKLQTAKINQGNTALKRVVESIANGDSHVPFRDSKLTMLLQDSFEDDKSKILMILCASPDPKELHKTVSTLEYGAKAKCIVRGPHTPIKDKGAEDPASAVILGSRIAALDQFISKLQMENRLKERERNEAQKELKKKEDEIAALRSKLIRNNDLEKRLEDCQKMAIETIEAEKRKMEQLVLLQQQEVENLRQRVKEIESEVLNSNPSRVGGGSLDIEGNSFVRKLLDTYSEDPGMVKSMDLDRSYDLDSGKHEVLVCKTGKLEHQTSFGFDNKRNSSKCEDDYEIPAPLSTYSSKSGLSTVFEEEEEEDISDEEVQKEVIEEKKICSSTLLSSIPEDSNITVTEESKSSRQARIQNIFTLCGNYREVSSSHHCHTPMPEKLSENFQTPRKVTVNRLSFENMVEGLKENQNPMEEERRDGDLVNLYVKWEASRENPGRLITTLKVPEESSLADVRKLIEIHLGADNQAFSFLVLEDPAGAPVAKEKEATMLASKLPPFCNNQVRGHLACLRPSKAVQQKVASTTPLHHHVPFSPLENKIPVTPMASIVKKSDCISPDFPEHLNSTPFVTVRRF